MIFPRCFVIEEKCAPFGCVVIRKEIRAGGVRIRGRKCHEHLSLVAIRLYLLLTTITVIPHVGFGWKVQNSVVLYS